MMKRTNTFALAPTSEQRQRLFQVADACASLWNELNYRRRQSFFKGQISWEDRDLYDKYKGVVGSATAQQIQRKNSEAWKSFFALFRLKAEGKLSPHIHKVSPPRYWKDRETGKRKLLILIRCDCYRLEAGGALRLPGKLGTVRWKGNPKWTSQLIVRQGLLTLAYDPVRQKWYARQSVEINPLHQPLSDKRAYLDLGILELVTVAADGWRQTLAYSGRQALADWWYLSHRIDELKSQAAETNGRRTTRQIQVLFRRRTLRFRQRVNTAVRRAIDLLWREGVSEIVVGDLKNIRANVHGGWKSNTMVHNFWSHHYLAQRVREVAEEYGLSFKVVDERGTSSRCPRCSSSDVVKRGRLVKCRRCRLEGHRDAVGSVNIGLAQGGNFPAEAVNGAVARPLEIRV
jgi:putative transposase